MSMVDVLFLINSHICLQSKSFLFDLDSRTYGRELYDNYELKLHYIPTDKGDVEFGLGNFTSKGTE